MILTLLVGVPILSLLFGYFLWKSAKDNYGYNIFSIGVILRLVIGILVCFFDINIGIGLLILFSIWNFIITYRNTSFIIAFIFLLFQPAAIFFAFWVLNRKWD